MIPVLYIEVMNKFRSAANKFMTADFNAKAVSSTEARTWKRSTSTKWYDDITPSTVRHFPRQTMATIPDFGQAHLSTTSK